MFSSEQWLANSGAGFYNGAATTSLRLDSASNQFLTQTLGTTNRTKFTFSVWIKRTKLGATQNIFSGGANSGENDYWFGFDGSDLLRFQNLTANSYNAQIITTRKFRDTSAWYNFVLSVDTTIEDSGTVIDRVRLYVNGVRETVTVTTQIANDALTAVNLSGSHKIGILSYSAIQKLDAYLSDVNFVDGTSLEPTAFGELKNGSWIPIAPSPTYGTNGYRLQFTSTTHDAPANNGSADTDNIGADSSGENNHFTAEDPIVASDCAMPDSPENNFCTYNPLDAKGNDNTYSEGNLKVVVNAQNQDEQTTGTFGVSSGKWYWEHRLVSTTTTAGYLKIGLRGTEGAIPAWTVRGTDGEPVAPDGSSGSSSVSYTTGSVIGVYLDMDNGKWYVSVDGSLQNSANLTNGTGFLHNNLTGELRPFILNASSGGTHTGIGNFGQDSTFGGLESAGGYSDSNGQGDFHSSVTSPYLALCTANLPEPTIGPNSDAGKSTDFFDTVLYAGNDSANHVIPASGDDPTSIDFTPDWISVKTRSGNDNHSHFWVTSSLGAGDYIKPDSTGASAGNDVSVMADIGNTANTFRTGSGVTLINGAGTNHVAWLWKNNGGTKQTLSAGSNASTNSNQVNQTAGISFNSFTTSTRNGSDVVFKHGLGVAPDWIMLKGMDSNNYIAVYSAAAGGTNLGLLGNDSNSGNVGDDAWATSNGYWGTIDATNVNFADNGNVGSSGEEVFAWCFAAKEGFSKFGFYKGNGNADGVFVYTGFRPAFVMIKSTTVAGQYWVIKDTRRDPVNPATNSLYWNTNDAEGTGILLDILSNGFKPRTNGNNHNNNGGSYVYMAFAEMPFKYANAR